MTRKENGPASVGALPDHGSITHPCMRKEEMNEALNTTAPAREQEMICDKVDRLARELSEALPSWMHGQFMAMVYPAGDVRGYWFRSLTRDENGNATDPLVKIINDHNKAWSEYCAVDFGAAEEAGLKEIWKRPHDVLCNWDNHLREAKSYRSHTEGDDRDYFMHCRLCGERDDDPADHLKNAEPYQNCEH